ncbi:unnamed protein product [Fraxinus pennsylvanica]|uniref:Small-subunit processome Utp12 domain-containing protein n=1 Tax=Fraxinus pennsylvanica TaxID=56036 RepID=A0AAD1ZB90_9LAMI|nr:unnamed protein product [Fraxinus pennsylvanica]
MVKSYLRYEAAASFGVIASVDSNITYDNSGKHLLAAALEKLGVWHVRQGICTKTLAPSPSSSLGPSLAVTSIASSPSSLIACGYADGSVRIWDTEKGTCETTLNGHKGAVTVLRYNKVGSLLASGSKDNDIILWDVVGEAGLFRLRGHRDQVTDLVLLDSGKKLVSSSKDKFLRVWDLETQHCMQIVSGHHSEIWSIDVDPDEKYLVSGSADPELRFYMIKHDLADGKTPLDKNESDAGNGNTSAQNKWEVLKHYGEIQRQSKDRVATVRFNKSGNLLACQVAGKIVEIYRVLDESESRRKAKRRVNRKKEKKASKGADKNLKIWGLDFGDCHKSLFAHADSVMAVKFVRNTHYMFSVGKDRLVKYWDADKFELLLTLEGHHSEVWCLAISNRGDYLVTGSHDRSIRRWDRTEEPFFVEEEKEKRLEEMFESDIDHAFENRYLPKEELPEEGAVALAGKKTQETINATDLIIESIDMAEEELKRIAEHEEEKSKGKVTDFRPNILMLGLSPSDYVLRAVSNVHTNDLEQTLLALPFSDALKIFSYLKDWASLPNKVELVCRVATVLLQIHHNQLVATVAARPVLTLLKDILRARVKECKDTLGFNLAAMDHLKQLMAAKSDALFRDAKSKVLEIRSKYSKRAEARMEPKEERRKKKKQKKIDNGHVWS